MGEMINKQTPDRKPKRLIDKWVYRSIDRLIDRLGQGSLTSSGHRPRPEASEFIDPQPVIKGVQSDRTLIIGSADNGDAINSNDDVSANKDGKDDDDGDIDNDDSKDNYSNGDENNKDNDENNK